MQNFNLTELELAVNKVLAKFKYLIPIIPLLDFIKIMNSINKIMIFDPWILQNMPLSNNMFIHSKLQLGQFIVLCKNMFLKNLGDALYNHFLQS